MNPSIDDLRYRFFSGIREFVDNGNGTVSEVVTVSKSLDDWSSIVITGSTRDPSKDITQVFGDGTVQTIYFNTNGDWAGRSARV